MGITAAGTVAPMARAIMAVMRSTGGGTAGYAHGHHKQRHWRYSDRHHPPHYWRPPVYRDSGYGIQLFYYGH